MKNLQDEWARLLMSSLAKAGVRDAVLSPGSRSTPFVLAAADEASLVTYDVADERSAAFFALGQARLSGRPTLLVCTSGTAGANYLPAVVEASASYVPLLVLTADRPPELRHCGANQTIDQVKLFGGHARFFADLGLPDASPGALRALRRTAAQAVFATLHPEPGAVHLNAPARKPLEPPTSPPTEAERELTGTVRALRGSPIVRPRRPRLAPDPDGVRDLAARLLSSERGLLVCGPGGVKERGAYGPLVEAARHTGYPLLADAASQHRLRGARRADAAFVDGYPFLLADAGFRARHQPEIVVQVGRAPTTSAWERYLAEHAGAEHWVLASHGWQDPLSTASHLLVADVGEAVAALFLELVSRPLRTSAWTKAWHDADQVVARLLDEELAATPELTEGAVARAAAAALPEDGLLVVGNSLPIRQVDAWVRGGKVDVRVASQRGASGIDGVISGACGAAVAAERPAVLLIGDVSFLHDLSGLAAAGHVRTPLAIVVVQNQGGRIFEMLPLASHPAAAGKMEHWTTPPRADFAAAAAVHGIPYVRVEDRERLAEALNTALRTFTVTVVEAVVEPRGVVEQNRRVASRLAAELAPDSNERQ